MIAGLAPHRIHDLAYDEDRCQIRTASASRVMATLRNLAITILPLAGHAKARLWQ